MLSLRRPISFAALLTGALWAAACPGFGDREPSSGALEPPTYVESVGELLERRCAACHAGDERAEDSFRLDRCEDEGVVLGARSMAGRILEQVDVDAMPKEREPLLPEEKALLAAWQKVDGACQPAYRDHVAPLLEAYCVACHGPDTPRDRDTPPTLRLDHCEDPTASDALGAKAAADLMRVWLEDSRNPMPPLGEETRPTDAEVARLLLWIDRGAPCPADEAAAELE